MTTLLLRRALLPALTLVLLAACDRDALAPSAPALAGTSALSTVAAATDEERDHPNYHQVEFGEHVMDRLVTFGCGPLDEGSTELVSVEGVARRKDISMNRADGAGVWRIQIQPTMLEGVGLRTGQPYVVTTQGGDYSIYADDFAKGTKREIWSMRNLATGEKYSLSYLVRWEVDADWNVIEHRVEEKVQCVK